MDQDTRHRPHKLALAGGFLALALAVAMAYRHPATGYELSIYRATPLGFWLGVGTATAVGLWVALTTDGRVRDGAHALATAALLSVLALPVIRGYLFYGRGDALTHLGWAREMDAGVLNPLANLYPGIHLTASFLHELAGVELTRALVALPVLVYPLAFVVFTALCVAFVSRRPWAATVGMFAALLFVPINQVSIFTVAHPSSQAIMFVPVVFYLLFRYLYAPEGRAGVLSAAGATFVIAGLGLLALHPQETMNLLAVLGAIVVVQFVARRRGRREEAPPGEDAIEAHRPLYAPTALLGGAFFAWTFRHERARTRVEFVLRSLIEGGTALEETGGRVASLQALGGSVEEVFLKLFGVALVLGIVAAVVVLRTVAGRTQPTSPRRHALVTYLGAGLVPLGGLFVLVFAARQGDHFFRFLGFILVPITILGAVGIAGGVARLGRRTSGWRVVAAVVVFFALAIPAQAAVYHKSPYMYQDNKQVTDATMAGYESAFEYREDEVEMMGLRNGPFRWVDAVYGRERAQNSLEFPGYRTGVPGPIFNENLTTAYADDRYLALHEATYRREVDLLRGLRYRERGFDRLATSPSVHRVQTTGDFDLYRIEESGT